MKAFIFMVAIGLVVGMAHPAQAEEQDMPDILCELASAGDVVLLQDEAMADIQGTGFLDWHPPVLQSLITFLRAEPDDRVVILRQHVRFLFQWWRDNRPM